MLSNWLVVTYAYDDMHSKCITMLFRNLNQLSLSLRMYIEHNNNIIARLARLLQEDRDQDQVYWRETKI